VRQCESLGARLMEGGFGYSDAPMSKYDNEVALGVADLNEEQADEGACHRRESLLTTALGGDELHGPPGGSGCSDRSPR
jgi:hypothetical protein